MFLDIRDLELRSVQFEEKFPPGRIDLGSSIRQVEPLDAKGMAELVASEIHLEGALQTTVEVTCDRCLEPTRRRVETEFDLFYRPMQEIAKGEDVEIRPADLEIGFYEGDGLLLEDVLKEQILLALPMKIICQEDCAGLCFQCGQNLNSGACQCPPLGADLHWAQLKKLKNTENA